MTSSARYAAGVPGRMSGNQGGTTESKFRPYEETGLFLFSLCTRAPRGKLSAELTGARCADRPENLSGPMGYTGA